ncbi:TonB-dependent receptor [Bacteroides sp.]
MKYTLAFLIMSIWGITLSYSQTPQLTLNVKDATMSQVLQAIEKQSGYTFVYDVNEVDMNQKVTLNVKNKPITNVLDILFANKKLGYKISDYHIALYRKTVTTQHATKPITGFIADENGEAIIGANILVKGTTNGVITDVDGNFSLNVAPGTTLQISCVGYTPREIKATNDAPLNIVLKDDLQTLQEVVVVGYGVQKKINLTGAIATVGSKELEGRPITSVSAGLQGLVPGLTITQGSGQPGKDGGTIRIRGVGTLNNSTPMILVDGIESSMDDVDPNEIASVSVLKDASSAAIYGSKAANGVILITTKRGSVDKTKITYSTNIGWQSPTELPEHLTAWDYATLYNESLAYDGKAPRFTNEEIEKLRNGSDPYRYANTDWQKLLYTGAGFQQQHNINIAGGTEKVRYMSSIGYQQQTGIIQHVSKKQFNARINLDITPVKGLEINTSLSFTNRDIVEPTNPYTGNMGMYFSMVNCMAPWIPYKDANGYYGTTSEGNPIAWMDLGSTNDQTERRVNALGSVKYEFFPGFSIKAQGTYRVYADDSHEFIKDIWYTPTQYHGPNKLTEISQFSTMNTGDVIANYKKDLGKHSIEAMAGFHSEIYNGKKTTAMRQNFPSNDLTDLDAGSPKGQKSEGYSEKLAMLSYFGRLNYSYADKYLLEANVRSDASSRFTKGNRWGVFPSFSAGWRISEEAFMEFLKGVISNLKLRGSWGKLGNQSALDYYPAIPIIGLESNYPFNGQIISGAAQTEAKKSAISWEKTRTWGIGADITLFGSLNLSFDYYDRLTTDILMEINAPATFGLDGYVDNIGKVSNKGIEASVNYNFQIKKVSLFVGGNFAYNVNKLLDLGGDDYMTDGAHKIKKVGYALNSFYGYRTAGLFQNETEIANWAKYKMSGTKVLPGDLKYIDTSKNGEVNAEDRVVFSSSDPKFTFGFNLGAKAYGFDVSMFLQGAAGVSGYMESEAIGHFSGDTAWPNTMWLKRWTPENPNTDVPRVSSASGVSRPEKITSDYWIQNANYLRLKNLQIGYTLPKAWLTKTGIENIRVYYSGQNLLTFTSFLKGWDPESPAGRGSHYPQVKVNSFGVNLTF